MVLRKNYQQVLEQSLIIGLFILANVSAFLTYIWLIPGILIIELVLWLILAALCAWFLYKHKFVTSFFKNLQKSWFIIPFLIFSGFSIFWSINWDVSLSRWLIFLFTIIAAGYIGLRYRIGEIIKLLSVFGIYILLISSALIYFVPRIGVMNYHIIQGAWKGLYWHKNHMGFIAVFISVLFLMNMIYCIQNKEKDSFLWGILYLFSLLFVSQTDSVAAYITILGLHGLILLALIFMKYEKKMNIKHYMVFAFIGAITSIILYINSEHIFKLFNRSPTLTGRIPMWAYLLETYFSQRPLFGYGFNAFWYVEAYRIDIGLAANYPDPILIADNGFIDILMNTGYIGMTLFLLFYFGVWWHVIKYTTRASNIYEVFPLILMSFTLIANITWSLFFENEGFFMLIMISILFSMSVKTPMSSEN